MKRAVLVVKGEEPRVVTFEGRGYDEYSDILRKALSDKEKSIAEFYSVESFGSGIPGVFGYVESFSAMHPYERNREWYGSALFVQYDIEGDCVNMSDENIAKLTDMFSLKNGVHSPSNYVNEFLDKYAKSQMHNITIGSHHGILDTMDAADFLKKANSDEDVAFVEQILKDIERHSEEGEASVEELLTDYLKEINYFLFSKKVEEYNAFNV